MLSEVTTFDVITRFPLWVATVSSDSVVVVGLGNLVEVPVEVPSDVE